MFYLHIVYHYDKSYYHMWMDSFQLFIHYVVRYKKETWFRF